MASKSKEAKTVANEKRTDPIDEMKDQGSAESQPLDTSDLRQVVGGSSEVIEGVSVGIVEPDDDNSTGGSTGTLRVPSS